jgi:quercetin dioxygenase-like cupin family protein
MKLRPVLFSCVLTPFFAAGALACPTHHVEVGAATAKSDEPIAAREVLDTPFVKLVEITMKPGAVLADHSVPQAITVQATRGSATLKVGDVTEALTPGAVVLVAPGMKHAVTAGGAETVVLLHLLPLPAGPATAEAAKPAPAQGHAH